MIGDKLIVKPYHLPPALEIVRALLPVISKHSSPYIISIAGESGSGKSTLAMAIKEVLEEQQLDTFIFHMDDYFFLPPTSNHNQRLESLDFVGPHEVNLDLLNHHLAKVKSGDTTITKPIIHYKENDIRTELADLSQTKVVLVEGTYVSLLEEIDQRVFLSRNYKDTYEDRLARARDVIDEYGEQILEIEHIIIRSHKIKADVIVDQGYKILFV